MAMFDQQQNDCNCQISEQAKAKSSSQLEGDITRPLVYRLVRIEDDGTVVPASDDEVIEVDSLLQNPVKQIGSEVYENEQVIHPCKQEISQELKNDVLDVQKVESLQSERKKLLLQLQFLDGILEKLKHEVHIPAKTEKTVTFPEINCANDAWDLVEKAIGDRLLSGSTSSCLQYPSLELLLPYECSRDLQNPFSSSKEIWINSDSQPASRSGPKQNGVTETVSRQHHIHSSDTSLDSLSIKELHGAFWSTFGRETSVKDKQWLKRRIALGLKGSQNVESRMLPDKDEKRNSRVRSEMDSPAEKPEFSPALFQGQDVRNHSEQIFDNKGISCQGGQTLLPSPRVSNSGGNSNHNGNLQICQVTESKRKRKPTRRYIEELTVKDAKTMHGRTPHAKKLVKYTSKKVSGDWEAESSELAVTGVKFATGFRGQRGNPKKITNMPMFHTWNTKGSSFSAHEGASGMEVFAHASSCFCSEEQVEIISTSKGGMRRKQHRPWTIREVMKLIEGVACCGVGKWAEIKKVAFPSSIYRTSVDLKDKWRNLLRASTSHLYLSKHRELGQKHTSPSMPLHILVQVQQLAAMHSQQQHANKTTILSQCRRTLVHQRLLMQKMLTH